MLVMLFAAILGLLSEVMPAVAQETEYRGLICRGVEETGRLFIGQPGFGPHLVSLFVTGPNPLSASHTLAQHMAWVNDPLHSYVADGTGGLVVWAHPSRGDAAAMLALPGLTGFDVNYAGDALSREALWDQVLTACCDAGRPFLWAFADDDTHSRTNINLSWYAARLPKQDEFALKAALRSGAFYVSNGPYISDIQVRGRAITLTLEQDSEVLWMASGQYLGATAPVTAAVGPDPGENHCLQRDRGVRESTLDLGKLGLPAAQLKFVRAAVRTAPDKVAQTQPWRLRADGSLENPYPAEGTWLRGQVHNHTDANPGNHTGIRDFRLAYQAKGQLGSFSTDYSYWESPHQWLPTDGTPQVESVSPDRIAAGQAVEVTIRGVNLDASATVHVGGRLLGVAGAEEGLLRVPIPADMAPGIHDLCVTNPNGFRGCLPQGFTVQETGARNAGWQSFSTADGLAYSSALCVACVGGGDAPERVWVGSVWGASCYQEDKWTAFRGELAGSSAYSIVPDPAGGVWFAGSSGLAFLSPEGQWLRQVVGHTEKLPAGRSVERWGRMAFDAAGRLWVTNRWGAGIGLRDDGQWRRLTRGEVPGDGSYAIACDAAGTVWGGFSALYRMEGGAWRMVPPPQALRTCTSVPVLTPAPDGSMWAAVTSGRPEEGGVVHYAGGEATAFLPSETTLPSPRIRDILVTRRGDVWFASDQGVAKLTVDGKWERYTSLTSGLVCNVVLGLAEDSRGGIWFATARGVSRFDPDA
jgi:streptogramin lyase